MSQAYKLIKNCRIVSPGLDIPRGDILIEGTRIAGIYDGTAHNTPALPAHETIDGEGFMALPGFVDVHCHGRNSHDFCDASEEGVNEIGLGKLSEGVTTLLPTTLTVSEQRLCDALSAIRRYNNRGCKMPAIHLEGPFVNPAMKGAQNPDHIRKPDAALVERLNAIYPIDKITYAPEMEGGVAFSDTMIRHGITPSITHSCAGYSIFSACHEHGLRNLSHFCNQMTPLHHRDIGLVGAGLLHDDVYCELSCDRIHICDEMIRLAFKVKGAEHIILITDAMSAAGMPDGLYDLGGLDVVVKDGAARLKEGGALAGSTLKLNVALKNVLEVTGLPLSSLVAASSLSAAQSLGLQGIGRIEQGYTADIVLLDSNMEVEKTFVDGELRFAK